MLLMSSVKGTSDFNSTNIKETWNVNKQSLIFDVLMLDGVLAQERLRLVISHDIHKSLFCIFLMADKLD